MMPQGIEENNSNSIEYLINSFQLLFPTTFFVNSFAIQFFDSFFLMIQEFELKTSHMVGR
jgi:hypothetical protein